MGEDSTADKRKTVIDRGKCKHRSKEWGERYENKQNKKQRESKKADEKDSYINNTENTKMRPNRLQEIKVKNKKTNQIKGPCATCYIDYYSTAKT